MLNVQLARNQARITQVVWAKPDTSVVTFDTTTDAGCLNAMQLCIQNDAQPADQQLGLQDLAQQAAAAYLRRNWSTLTQAERFIVLLLKTALDNN
jgi:hypothetical protein